MNPKIIAFYLPQFYPFKENNEWWGAGCTEWTNVAKAKPLFKGHEQPKIPADLSFYDLRVPETRIHQAELAKKAGVYGFCYWHYWFGNGKQLLNRVFDEVIESKSPNFPICLGWANHSWYAKTWDKKGGDRLLIEQIYPSKDDYIKHFNYVLNAFKDDRYIKKDNKPLFYIFDALNLPDDFINTWNNLAIENGFNGICFIGRIQNIKFYNNIKKKGFDYITVDRLKSGLDTSGTFSKRLRQIKTLLTGKPYNYYKYEYAIKYLTDYDVDSKDDIIPTLVPCWDHSPRSGRKALILDKSTPKLFRKHIKDVFNTIKNKSKDNQFILLKSWNEWGEGNYMEPDLKWGNEYINSLKEEVEKVKE